MTEYRLSLALLVGASTLACASGAFGQTNPQDQSSASSVDDIVVTAQRRSERLQDVPIAVKSMTAAALDQAGVHSLIELTNVAPSLVIERQVRGGVIFLRAVGSQATNMGQEGAIATYVDGVYYLNQTATLFSFNNIKDVEILYGPQGTLFGRNATGGLINITTRDPTVQPQLEANLSYGNYGTTEGSLYATGGVGRVAMDIAYYNIHQDEGFGHQLDLGGTVNYNRASAARSKLLWRPTDNDSITLAADWATNAGDIGFSRNLIPGSFGSNNLPFRGTIYDSQGGTPSKVLSSYNWGTSVHYEHDFHWGQFSSLSAFRNDFGAVEYDGDLTTQSIQTSDPTVQATHSFQQEFLLQGSNQRLNWTMGIFYLRGDSSYAPLSLRSTTNAAGNTDVHSGVILESLAGFAQADYALTSALKLTAGVRYTSDHEDTSGRKYAAPGYTAAPVGTVLQARDASATFNTPTWRVSLEDKFTDQILGYISYNRGFKAGSFNAADLTAPPIQPETINAYEAGLKTEMFGRRLRLNTAVFYYDYQNIQLTRTVLGAAQIFNAAGAEIAGMDVDGSLVVPTTLGRLELNGGFSLLPRAEYQSFPNGPLSTPKPGGGNITAAADLSGNRMIRAPHSTLTASLNYTLPVGPDEFGFNATYYHNTGFDWDPDNRLKQPEYSTVNASVFYGFGPGGHYRLRLWGKNLGDTKYYSYVTATSLGDLGSPAAPRTFGISFDVSY